MKKQEGMKSNFSFEILKTAKTGQARLGLLTTRHGRIQTPSFVAVGTQGTVKSLTNQDLTEIGIQVFFANTYHLYLRPGREIIRKMGGLHKFIGWERPLMTDSAGFQIFSLAAGHRRGLALPNDKVVLPLVEINDKGVIFRSHLDGSKHTFTPEKSIEIQKDLGADIMFSLDECTFYPATFEYTKMAMERTHRWAIRCLEESSKFIPPSAGQSAKLKRNNQAIYGVVQGGVFKDLRENSAKFISSLPFEGIAIGGVSVGESKKEMNNVLDWVVPLLPEDKPRHLLGVGEIDDVFCLVESGIDTFDCVMPTRLGRMGHTLVQSSKFKVQSCRWSIDITKAEYADDKGPIDERCECQVCKNYSRAYLNHLFRARELLAYRLATYHNLYFLERLMDKIRLSLKEENFSDLKKEWL